VTVSLVENPFDARLASQATGLLATFNTAGVISGADVHVASTLGRLTSERSEDVRLAAALAVRAVRHGSVCVDLSTVSTTVTTEADSEGTTDDEVPELPWPDVDGWLSACRASPLVASGVGGPADRPVRLVGSLLYLDRYWRQEQLVRDELSARAARTPPPLDASRLGTSLRKLFPGDQPDLQRLAAAAAAAGWVTVIAGGPGTGKTTTVARLVALLNDISDTPLRVALAAPTGKAAARLQESFAAESARLVDNGITTPGPLPASTLHRLLGSRPGSRSRFRHDRANRLPYDVVVVDEMSMVSLTLMSRLLEAVRPEARLVLVGDPDQLASVDAGAVLGDLVGRPARAVADSRESVLLATLPGDAAAAPRVRAELRTDVVRLRVPHRYGGAIGELAEAIRIGSPDDVVAVLRRGDPDVRLVEATIPERGLGSAVDVLRRDVVEAGRELYDAAIGGDADGALRALGRHRLLCGHRLGPYGVTRWSTEVERWLTSAIDRFDTTDEWYVGRPLVVTANDYETRLFNGDTGVVVEDPADGRLAVFGRGDSRVRLRPSRLSSVQTMHALTVHRSQGSQFQSVTVLLPPEESPLLTRELFYTAVTRAESSVGVVGTEAAVRAAVARPVVRASGLRMTPPES